MLTTNINITHVCIPFTKKTFIYLHSDFLYVLLYSLSKLFISNKLSLCNIIKTKDVPGLACSTILRDCHRKSNIVGIKKRPTRVIIVFCYGAHEFAYTCSMVKVMEPA